jgi:hypothetical protein
MKYAIFTKFKPYCKKAMIPSNTFRTVTHMFGACRGVKLNHEQFSSPFFPSFNAHLCISQGDGELRGFQKYLPLLYPWDFMAGIMSAGRLTPLPSDRPLQPAQVTVAMPVFL